MNQLKIILHSNFLYALLLIIILIYSITFFSLKNQHSSFTKTENHISGTIYDYEITENDLKVYIKTPEKIIANCIDCASKYKDIIKYGNKINIQGEIKEINNNTIPNMFNYKEYLQRNQIYYTFNIKNLSLIEENSNVFDSIRNIVDQKIQSYKSAEILRLFLLGKKNNLDEQYTYFVGNGTAHLLAISGLHTGLFILILTKLLKLINKTKAFIIIMIFLFFYALLCGFSISVVKCILFYCINKILKMNNIIIPNIKILIIVLFIVIIQNPYIIFDTGFLYSFIITSFIILAKLKKTSYFKALLYISILSFLAALPITANINYEINVLSILANVIFIPIITFILYPMVLMTIIFPFLDNILFISTDIIFNINQIFYNYLSFFVVIPKLNAITVLIYYVFLLLALKKKLNFLLVSILVIIINKLSYTIDSSYEIYYLDIGQGDCAVLVSPYQKEVIMIDTGGNLNYSSAGNIYKFLYSINIKNVDKLIITHGDYDHLGNAIELSKKLNFKELIINNNIINENEMLLIEKLNTTNDNINMRYFQSENYNIYVEESDDENSSSLVYQFDIYGVKFLFLGDISIENTMRIIEENNIESDFVKISHHGSKNNTTTEILENINPYNTIISVGRNNLYGHPHDEVVEIINEYSVENYQTNENGTIFIKISKNMYNILTFEP